MTLCLDLYCAVLQDRFSGNSVFPEHGYVTFVYYDTLTVSINKTDCRISDMISVTSSVNYVVQYSKYRDCLVSKGTPVCEPNQSLS